MPARVKKFAVLVTGGTDWHDGVLINDRLRYYPAGSILIHGDAKGADTLAGRLSPGNRLVEVRVPYIKWLGRGGGPARNRYMLKMLLGLKAIGYTARVEAFHDDLSVSRGTIDMMRQAKKSGVKVKWNHH